MNYKLLLSLFFIIISQSSYTQTLYRMNNVPVYHGTKLLKNPFTGGMNNSIVNQMDLNNDGKRDLVIIQQVFNQPNRIQTYINQGGANYIYTPRYEAFFPKYYNAVFQLRDMNEDKLEDIIFKTGQNFILFYGSRTNDSTILYTFYDTIEYISYDPLYGTQHISAMNLYLPMIQDLDKDGDMDIVYLKYGSLNKDERYYFRNYKKEKGLAANINEFHSDNKYYGQNSFSLDPLKFVGGYYTTMMKGEIPDPNINLQPRHDESQMIWDIDVNNDGLYDAIAYSENQRNAPLGINYGSKDSAHLVNYDTYFPSYNKPINKVMASGFWLDVDNDSKKDILVSAFIERDLSGTKLQDKVFNDDVNTISYYRNFGPKAIPVGGKYHDSFELITDSFLAIETVDVGTGSQPLFYNYDQDSLIDILIPNQMKRDSWEVASISYYRNIGTKSQPQYKLVTKDLFNFKQTNRANIRLAAGDLNNDGKEDLIVSSHDRILHGVVAVSPNAEIKYDIFYQYSNNGTITMLAEPLLIDYSGKLGRSNICIYDVDKDGKKDIFIGDLYSLKYYKNTGTTTKPLFDQVTCDSVISNCSIYCFPTPFYFFPAVWTDPNDNKDYLFFAYHFDGGKIGKALIDTAKLNNNKSLVNSSLDLFNNYSISYNPTIQVKDITNDGKAEFLIGNYAGGLQLFSFDSLTGAKDPPPPPPPSSISSIQDLGLIQIYPNPSVGIVNIVLPSYKQNMILNIYSIDGKLVMNQILNSKNESIDMQSMNDGMYFFQFSTENEQKKLIKFWKKSQ
jgi:hypothetical protein